MASYYVTIPAVGQLSVSNVSLRLRDGTDSYAQVTLPFSAAVADAISAALPTTLSVYRNDSLVVTVDIDRVQGDVGSNQASLAISGHDVVAWGAPTAVDLGNSVNYYTYSASPTYRIPVDVSIIPGAVVTGPAGEITVSYVSITANNNGETMEIS